jgi:hypothetical protein
MCKTITQWPESVSELYRPRDRRLPAKIVPTSADRVRHVVSVTDPHGRILDFLEVLRNLEHVFSTDNVMQSFVCPEHFGSFDL